MMRKFFRIASTLMIMVGIAFLLFYIQAITGDRAEILNQPSYYKVQNYLLAFVSGGAVIGFSLLGSFFSWFKEFDAADEALPNAGYASSDEIDTWVQGSAADSENGDSQKDGATEVLGDDGKTEIVDDEEGTKQ